MIIVYSLIAAICEALRAHLQMRYSTSIPIIINIILLLSISTIVEITTDKNI